MSESTESSRAGKRTHHDASTAVEPSPSHEFPRGIAPPILLDHVRNTVPFIFHEPEALASRPGLLKAPFVERLRAAADDLSEGPLELSHQDYFALCLAAHYATVATFVPTDVDNQIRFKLWHPGLPEDIVFAMSDLVMASLHWDSSVVSTRLVRLKAGAMPLSGHHGEWFSTAVAAYGALRRPSPERAEEMRAAIIGEVAREAQIFMEFKKRGDGLNMLRAATLIAHNLGDLDRVIDMWNIGEDDELKRAVYKCGHDEGCTRFGGAMTLAGRLNKALMAVENHRHFALRGPKCLRQSPDFLLPVGSFFDDWGQTVGAHPLLSPDEIGEVVQALVEGWDWLNKGKQPGPGKAALGYSRALAGIIDSFPGGFGEIARVIPARTERHMKAGVMRTQVNVPRARFEEQWSGMALKLVR